MNNEELKNTMPSKNRKDRFKLAHHDETIHDTKFETKPVSYLQDCLRRFVKNKASVVAAIIIAIIGLFAIVEPIVDPKNHVSEQDFSNGEFYDANYKGVLPRNDLFLGTGFWDGTETRELDELRYDIYRQNDSNYPTIVKVLEVKEPNPNLPASIAQTKTYTVRWDTYAIGCTNVYISKAEYEALAEYDVSGKLENTIIKPRVDSDTYLASLRQRFVSEGVADTTISTIIQNLDTYYKNNPNFFFKLEPTKTANGTYRDSQYQITDEDGDGFADDIYMRDENGDLVYYTVDNGQYVVRVDYFDYFTYKYGFKPVYLLGSNLQGQDILLRLALGARFSLLLGIGITVINFIIGLIWGAISGYYGGKVDLIMERFTDIISNIPTVIIMSIASVQLVNNIELKEILGPAGVIIAAIFIAFIYNGWVGVAATTRMQFYRFKGQEYVLASRTLGAKDRRLIFKHILPNATGTLVTRCVLMVPSIIFSEASLSYLGIINFESSGIYSIGAMINEGKAAGILAYPHILLFPSIVISLLMITFNLFGNGLRDAFNTQLRGSEE